MKSKIFGVFFSILLLTSLAAAQKTEVTVSFNEQFFDALLDALFTNLKQPDFPLAKNSSKFKVQSSGCARRFSFATGKFTRRSLFRVRTVRL
jgi:hypothetical protein